MMSADAPEPDALHCEPNGGFPNSAWPVLWYHDLLASQAIDKAETFETLFAQHGWQPQWRHTMYDFDHFHSTAHEALGVFRGTATVCLGGPHGRQIEVHAGDVLVLPAGVGHRRSHASADFCMVGAYPDGQQWDTLRGDPAQLAAATERIAGLPVPDRSPVGGAMMRFWRCD